MKSLKLFSAFAIILVALIAIPTAAQQTDDEDLPTRIYLPLVQSTSLHSNDAQLQAEIMFRQAIGFPSTVDYILSVHAMPNAVTLESVSATFTPDEAAEVLTRLDLERDVEVLQRYFTEHPERQKALGGVYIDHAAGGKLVLQLVQRQGANTQIVQTLPALQHPDRLQINFVSWSNQHLQQQYETISAAMPLHTELEAVLINQVANQVEILINPAAATVNAGAVVEKRSLAANLATLVADPAVTIRAEAVQLIDTAVSGGNSWNNTGSGVRCTLGFEVTYSGGNGMVTAGHCMTALSSGTNVYWGATQIGTVTNLRVDGSTVGFTHQDSIDAGVLKMNNGSTATDNIVPMSDILGSTNIYTVGLVRCMSGATSGRVCGTIVVSSINIQASGTGRYYGDMFYTSIVPQGGDSGAPISQDDGQFAYITGINKGQVSHNGQVRGIHSKWSRIQSRFGLSLVTTD